MITDPPPNPPPAYASALLPPSNSDSTTAGDGGSSGGAPESWKQQQQEQSQQGAGGSGGAGGGGAGVDAAGGAVDSTAAAVGGMSLAPLGSAAAFAAEPRSLQDVCSRVIQRHLSVHNCCELCAVARGVEGPAFTALAAASLRYAVRSFETLMGLRSEEQLRTTLGGEVYDSLHAALQERQSLLSGIRGALGRVREREAPQGEAAAPRQGPSVSGRPVSYPLAALGPNMAWPAEVEGGAREQWLGAEDFDAAFGGLSYPQFLALPGWRRSKLKQAAGLF